MYWTKFCFQLYIPTLLPWYSNLCTMIYILRPKVHILHYRNPSNFAECKVAVTKIVSLLWMLADVVTKIVQIYTRLFVLISISLFALPSLFFSLKSGRFDGPKKPSPREPKSFSLGYTEHLLPHFNDHFIMRKASRYKRGKFKSIDLGVSGRRLNDILQELCKARPAWAQHLCLAGDWSRAAA